MKEAKLIEFNSINFEAIKDISQQKEIIVFDLDGTLTLSKTAMDNEMSKLLTKLLEHKKVGVMSGGSYPQFKKQFIQFLDKEGKGFENLFLYPTCGSCMYKWNGHDWEIVYKNTISPENIKRIFKEFNNTLNDINFPHPEQIWGDQLENRESQVTWSGLGQDAPREKKHIWDPDFKKRLEIIKHLKLRLKDFDIKIGGSTSIDITLKGVDKGYGMNKIVEHLGIKKEDILFIGDAMFKGGNDYPAYLAGVDSIRIKSHEETKTIIGLIVENY